jgi:hypothetical protein
MSVVSTTRSHCVLESDCFLLCGESRVLDRRDIP